ncbi:MAG: hypothetical protein K0B02_04900 [DPANN group archaeon]|nr:hypothetical protein [DPANN group archaeon]
MTKKALSAAVWYVMAIMLAILMVLVLVNVFGKSMEMAGNTTKETINMSFTPIQCIAECNICCSDPNEQDCSNLPSECSCDDTDTRNPGC